MILAALAATLLAFWAGEGWMPGHRSIEPLASAVTVGVEICIRLMLLLLFWVLLTPARPPEAEDGGWPFRPGDGDGIPGGISPSRACTGNIVCTNAMG